MGPGGRQLGQHLVIDRDPLVAPCVGLGLPDEGGPLAGVDVFDIELNSVFQADAAGAENPDQWAYSFISSARSSS